VGGRVGPCWGTWGRPVTVNGPLPAGTVTFLMTDVEGSTRLWEEAPGIAGAVIERHDALIAAEVGDSGGVLLKSKGEGDSTFSVFADACDGVVAAVELQRALRRESWPRGGDIRVRAALYTGDAELRDGDYHGVAPNRGARLRAAAHGGQTICCQATEKLVAGRSPPGVSLRDLGLHRLRDLARAERVFQVDHPELPQEFPPLRSLGVRHNLPSQRTSFVGRDADLAAVQKHLQGGRLVTLTGIGGCGKTRLAIEVASDHLEGFPDGVFFVDLAPVSDGAGVPGTVAAVVGFTRMALGTGSGLAASELIDFLSMREVLLVIDNCEHVIDACASLVDEILERCPGVSVLATSREALDLQGEQTYPVAPLAVAEDPSEGSPSMRLFCDRASLARPDFAMTSADASDVAEICRRLDGIPLALELAAAQVPHLSPHQIVERLDDRFRLLARGRGRARRQQTMHGTLGWSHELLAEDERVVFRRLAVFPGSFSHRAADEVCDDRAAYGSLRALVRKSLVVMEDDGVDRRFRLLETVRVYAEARLVEAGEDSLIRNRHRGHYLAWAESIPPEKTYLDPDGSIRRERHNLRAALRWSEAQGRPDLVGRIASTMNRVWIADIREGRRWLSVGLEGLDDLDLDQRVRLLAIAAHVAVLAIQARDGDLARRAVEASEQRPGVWSSLAHSLLCLNAGLRGLSTKDPGVAKEVERLGLKAVELAPEPVSRELAWFWLGQARVLVDDFEGAIDALEKGSVEVLPGGDMSAVSLAMLAGMLHLTGRHEDAFAAAAEVVERAKSFPRSGLWSWVLYCSLPHALELSQHGRHAEAISFVRDLLEESGTPRTPGVMTSVVVVLAALALLRDDEDRGGLLLAYAGRSLVEQGIRTPIDLALYTHYLERLRGSIDKAAERRNRKRAAKMTMSDAIAYGLEPPS
jgi:predicted ATPase/class 3 adenylate cyclase